MVAATGCYSPSYRDCDVTCTASQSCPSGLTCSNNHCVAVAGTSCADSDGGTDGRSIDAVNLGPWGAASPIPIAPPLGNDDDPTVSHDGLELYFNRIDLTSNASEIFRSVRAAANATWPAAEVVPELDSNISDGTPELADDGLSLYFSSGRQPSQNNDIWMATRSAPSGPWETVTQVVELSSSAVEASPAMSSDGLAIVFHSLRNGDSDLFMSERGMIGKPWAPPVPLSTLNRATQIEESPFLSADKLAIYFSANWTGDNDLYVATRATTSSAFGAPTPIAELNTAGVGESDPFVTTDGRHIYFTQTDAQGIGRLYEAVR
jgi:hypothetical protein